MKSFVKITTEVAFPSGGDSCFLYESAIYPIRNVEALRAYYRANNITKHLTILNEDS